MARGNANYMKGNLMTTKQAWYYDNGAVWQAWGSDAVEMICGPMDEFHGKNIVADHNALLNIPDPKAFMAAHDKLVAVCEALRIERGMLALAMDGDNEEMHVELNEVEAALKALAAVKATQPS